MIIHTFVHLNDVDISPNEPQTGEPCVPEPNNR